VVGWVGWCSRELSSYRGEVHGHLVRAGCLAEKLAVLTESQVLQCSHEVIDEAWSARKGRSGEVDSVMRVGIET